MDKSISIKTKRDILYFVLKLFIGKNYTFSILHTYSSIALKNSGFGHSPACTLFRKTAEYSPNTTFPPLNHESAAPIMQAIEYTSFQKNFSVS
jgi:hypothetical protein